jgi:hypothetical protein
VRLARSFMMVVGCEAVDVSGEGGGILERHAYLLYVAENGGYVIG